MGYFVTESSTLTPVENDINGVSTKSFGRTGIDTQSKIANQPPPMSTMPTGGVHNTLQGKSMLLVG